MLTENMRAKEDPEYAKLLENVGNGFVNGREDPKVRMNPKCIVQTPDEVIDFIYDDMSKPVS